MSLLSFKLYITIESELGATQMENKKHTDTTYRVLHVNFRSINMDNLAELCDIMKWPIPAIVSIMKRYHETLRKQYKRYQLLELTSLAPKAIRGLNQLTLD